MRFNRKEIALALLIMLGSFLVTFLPLWDPDCFWHLAFGKIIVENRELPRTEPFAFSTEGKTIVDLSWLPHIVFYLAYKCFGYLGTEILPSFFAAISMFILIMLSKAKNSKIISLSIYFLLFYNAFGARFRLRPEGFSLVLFSLLVYFLYLYNKNNSINLYCYYLLFLIWAQIHQSWIYGLIIIPFFILEKHYSDLRKGLFKDSLLYFAIPFFILMIHPYGIEPFLFPFKSFLTMKSDSSFSIAEWQKSPFELSTAPFLIFSFFMVVFQLLRFLKKKETLFPFLVVFVQFILLISWVRYSSFAFIALTPYSLTFFDLLLSYVKKYEKAMNALIFVLLLIPSFLVMKYQPTENLLKINYPEKETDFLIENNISGKVIHTFVAGGFVEFKICPPSKSFFDGRYFDFEKQIKEYNEARRDIVKFREFINKYPFEIALMPYTNALVKDENNIYRNAQAFFFDKKKWAPVFYGPYGAVFLKRTPKNEKVIEKYEYKILFPYDKDFISLSIRKGEIKEEVLKEEIERAFKTDAKFLRE